MTVTHGFELIRESNIPELNTTARIWKHVRSGAQLLSMELDDENKVFGISFKTPPNDSTGLPHIMEHSVLAGSEKYPLKEPFIELVKGSLASFINAFTMPDRTMYPAASTNLQDFYNLIDVYMDAVLHPLLTPYHLHQEGWHYELESADDPLAYKGVVFNEMKGAYSSPDDVLGRAARQSLFPDTTYHLDYGGDPAVIPDLTFEQFTQFHATYYHPSNAMIYFYGDDDPEERLRLMNGYLESFAAADIDTNVALQPSFDVPRTLNVPYSVSADDGDEQTGKAMVQINWLLDEYSDVERVMALEVLSHALLDTPASPLRKALIDSGLGEEVTGGGLSTYMRQMTFAAGLKGVDHADVDQVEYLILETLSQLADEGIDPAMIEAAVNTIEFQLRENNTGRFPRGLALMMRALDTWAHDLDPLAPLAYEAPLSAVKERLETKPNYLSSLIRVYLVDNSHRTTVILEPDPELAARKEAEEQARLAAERAEMSAADLQDIIEEAAELKRRQEVPDPPEVLARLPSLTLADLDRDHKPIPLELSDVGGTQVFHHDLFTNGIVYLDVGMDLHALPAGLLPYASLFGQALVKMGTEAEGFVRLSQRIGSKTGGIHPTTLIAPVRDSVADSSWLMLRGKSTLAQAPELLAILGDMLLTAKLDDQERFRQIVLESKAGAEAQLAPAGHVVVNGRLRAHFNRAFWADDQVTGISQLFFLRELAEQIDNDWPAVLARLETVRALLVNRNAMLANVTLDADGYSIFGPELNEFLGTLPAGPEAEVDWIRGDLPPREGLSFPAQVNYVGKGANLYELGYERHGSMDVITNLLRTGYLWEKIRMQGGAYGGFCVFSRLSGVFSFISYRDPNLISTLDNYDGAADYLRHLDLHADELERNIIGAIGTLDAYELPDARGYTSLTRYLTGETDEALQIYRDQVLSTSEADFHALADVLDRLNAEGGIVVLGSVEALAAANDEDLGLEITKVL